MCFLKYLSLFIALLFSAFFASVGYSTELKKVGDFNFSGDFMGPGSYGEGKASTVKAISSGSVTTSTWSYPCLDYRCLPVVATSNMLVVLEGDQISGQGDDEYFVSSAVVAYAQNGGRELWRREVNGDRDYSAVALTEFNGREAISVINDRRVTILAADDGALLANLDAPRELSVAEFARYVKGVASGLSGTEIIETQGTHVWVFPNGRVFGMNGSTTAWSLDFEHLPQQRLRTFPWALLAIKPGFVLINYREFNQHYPNTKTVLINVATGRVEREYELASSVAMDQNWYYLRTIDGIDAFNRETFAPVWSTHDLRRNGSTDGLVVDDQHLFTVGVSQRPEEACGGRPKDLYLLNKSQGTILATFELREEVSSLALPVQGSGGVLVEQYARHYVSDEWGCNRTNASVVVGIQ